MPEFSCSILKKNGIGCKIKFGMRSDASSAKGLNNIHQNSFKVNGLESDKYGTKQDTF